MISLLPIFIKVLESQKLLTVKQRATLGRGTIWRFLQFGDATKLIHFGQFFYGPPVKDLLPYDTGCGTNLH